MLKENRAQLSLEYLLIFSISIIILLVFTIPLANTAFESISDVSDASNVNNELSKLAIAIDEVYSEGEFSKRTVFLNLNRDIVVNIQGGVINSDISLYSGDKKYFKIKTTDSDINTTLKLTQGENKIVINWLDGSNVILISKVF